MTLGTRIIETIAPARLGRSFRWLLSSFWFAFAGSAALVAILWRHFDHIAHTPVTDGPAH